MKVIKAITAKVADLVSRHDEELRQIDSLIAAQEQKIADENAKMGGNATVDKISAAVLAAAIAQGTVDALQTRRDIVAGTPAVPADILEQYTAEVRAHIAAEEKAHLHPIAVKLREIIANLDSQSATVNAANAAIQNWCNAAGTNALGHTIQNNALSLRTALNYALAIIDRDGL